MSNPGTTLLGPTVAGYCPMGCGQSLYVGKHGTVICCRPGCPHATAVTAILAEAEVEHLVTFREVGFTIRHPLRERIGNQLENCALHAWCEALDGPPVEPGRYRATLDTASYLDWHFEPAEDA